MDQVDSGEPKTFLPPSVNYLRSVSDTPFRKTFKPEEQDFYSLRQKCLSQGILFEDPQFPCTEESLQLIEPIFGDRVEWKRPKEIPGITKPTFIVDDVSRFDVIQGDLGDCWFLSTVASLTLHPELVRKVIPTDQSFDEEYAGIFHFRFWKYGKWTDVVVDDRLPILTKQRRVAFDYSSERNEFWSALLEKAYAKLYGSYGAIDGGFSSEAMTDLTGGVVVKYDLGDSLPSLDVFKVIQTAFHTPTFVTCGILSLSEKAQQLGLIKGHAYSVTGVQELRNGAVKLVRIRNPWGNDFEWKGPWSDRSSEWNGDAPEPKADGEFWMSIEDFCQYFCLLDICHYGSGGDKKWREMMVEGAWKQGVNAGGSRRFPDTYHRNPQLKFRLDADDCESEGGLVVSLVQVNRREQRQQCQRVAFHLYELEAVGKHQDPVPAVTLKITEPLQCITQQYSGRRDETARFKLKAGSYCIVPSTLKPGQEGEFLVRFLYLDSLSLSVFKPLQAGLGDLHDKFYKVSEMKNEITPKQLQKVLSKLFRNNEKQASLNWTAGFCYTKKTPEYTVSNEGCQGLVASFDADGSGTLSYEEFTRLWQDVSSWKDIFVEHDTDKSGTLPIKEVQQILSKRGLDDIIESKELRAKKIADDHPLNFEGSLSFALQF